MAYAINKKAHFDYEILETYEAGIELLGFEVKSVRAKRAKLEGARVIIRGSEAFLVGASIPPYQRLNTPKEYDEQRTRRLLLHKKEIAHLTGKEHERGLTLIPIKMYNKGRSIKLEFGIARGKKKYDKREIIKERETKRKISRELKHF